MEITINTLAERITGGVALGWTSQEVKEAARQFMKDNGYKLSETGKQVAIAELQDLDYPEEVIAAVSMAIVLLEGK